MMLVYSGKCRLCETGKAVGFRDMEGKELSTGDIVAIWSERGPSPVLTVVVSDQFESFSDGSHEENESPEYFVMGLKSVNLADEPGYWRVFKLKDHADVIDGEHWSAWGFSFKSSEAAELAREQGL